MRRQLVLPGISLSDVLLRLSDNEKQVCALASTDSEGWETIATWNPAATFACEKDESATGNAQRLEAFVSKQQRAGRLVIGYLSYDFGCALRGVALSAIDDLDTPPVFVASFDNWLEFDAAGATVEAGDASFTLNVQRILRRSPRPLPTQAYTKTLTPTQSRSWYHQAYQKVQAHIVQGDVYQINLTHRLHGTTNTRGHDLFCLLHKHRQANFQAYIANGNAEILSYSPERFISVTDRLITTMPIKGTRPRGATAAEDTALQADLLHNPKDRAELDMITDLMRNDLGKICTTGSVRVVEPRTLTAYPTLWHAHATITGQLRPDVSPIAALMNMSPGGSITGCPKKRAIEIIDELEPQRRGVYTGSIFTIKPSGELDSSIAIRTLVKKATQLYLSVGGGVVYDSTENDEYQESLDKAASFVTGSKSLGKDI